jgi:CubicO group peptidase (beta-lactamase class C family)
MMRRIVIPFCLVLVIALTGTVSASVFRSDDALTAKVDSVFSLWNKPDSPGCAVAVIKDGAIIYKRGYGMANLEQRVPIAPDTAFYICSTSKQFTAMSIALLEEQGKLSLDDDIRKYLPEMPAYERPVTIRHLIHHTSGLRDYLMLWTLAGRNFADSIAEAEAIELIARQKSLNFTPGDQYLYSNSGYFLLSVIVKRASGKSLREFADEYIFKPLGMRNTHFHDDKTMLIPRRADGYNPRSDGFSLVKTSFDLVGDGGLYTTAEDLFLWDQNFYHNKLGKGVQSLIDRVLTRGKLNSGKEISYAFGLGIEEYRGLKMVAHGGAFIGFRTEMIRFPEQKFSVIVLSNLGTTDASLFAKKVADIYLADSFKSDAPAAPVAGQNNSTEKTERIKLSPEQMNEYAGEYYSEELKATYYIKAESEKMSLRIGYNAAQPLEPAAKDQFSQWGGRLVFFRDQQSRVAGFTLDLGRVKNLRFVKK